MARKPIPEPDFDRELADLPPSLRWREWKARVEAVLFAAAKPVTREVLARVVGRDCALELLIDDLKEDLLGRPIQLVRAGECFSLHTRPAFGPAIRVAFDIPADAKALTKLEAGVLMAIAMFQPVTRGDISEMFGREISRDLIAGLLEEGLIAPDHPETLHYRGECVFVASGTVMSRRSMLPPGMLCGSRRHCGCGRPSRLVRRPRAARREDRLRRRPRAAAPRPEWVVYAKRPFAGPKAVLAYLARYTHRVAISNSRLVALDDKGVTFKWKDYRVESRDRFKTMTLDAAEFIRRFLLHVLPAGFHRIRHYGLFAGAVRARNIEFVRQSLAAAQNATQPSPAEADGRADDLSPARRRVAAAG